MLYVFAFTFFFAGFFKNLQGSYIPRLLMTEGYVEVPHF